MPQQNAKVAIELYVDDKGSVRVKEFSGKSQEEFRKVESSGSGAADKIGGSWSKVVGVWGMVTAAATAAFAAVSALVITSAKEAKELENLARLAKMGSGEFKEYAYAAESAGIPLDKFADISKDVQDKLGDFIATGGGEFLDFMENVAPKVGLTVEQLQKLSGPDVLVAVKKAMDDANVSAAEQVFYLESIADDATLLIPLLEKNGQALKEQAARAKELGIALSEVDSKKLREAGAATREATSAFGGLKDSIAAELAPVFADFMNWATDRMVDWKDEIRAVSGAILGAGESVFYFFRGGFQAVAAASLAVSGGIFKIIEGVTGLTDKLHITNNAAAEWKMNAEAAFGAADELAMKANQSYQIMLGSTEAVAKSQAALAQEGAKGQKGLQNEINRTTNALKYQEKERQKILDKHKSEAEKQADAEKEMYEEAGLGAEKYFSSEATELVRKAARWKKAGADVYSVEQWLYDQLGKLADKAFEAGELAASQNVQSIKDMTGTITEQFNEAETDGAKALERLGMKADELNGKEIVLAARLDGSAVVTGVNSLIQDIQRLNTEVSAATSSVPAVSTLASGGYQNTDPNMSASQVAAAESAYYGKNAAGTTIINFNQQMSRSDAVAIANETKRREARS